MMTFPWRRRRGGKSGEREAKEGINSEMELTIPTHFRCPISLDLMKDPVTLSTGISYDRESIEKWIETGNVTCPVTNQVLRSFDLIPNHSIRKMIQFWCVDNKSYGVERIPTPRIPITPYEVSEICKGISGATQRGDSRKCLDLIKKIKNLAKESERNKKCIVNNGLGLVLADSFDSWARVLIDQNAILLEEMLSILTWTFPSSPDGISRLRSPVSLQCMERFLKGKEDLYSRQNAVSVLKELVSADQDSVDSLTEIDGIEETLYQIVKFPISPKATKACLVIISHMMDKSGKIVLEFVQKGLVPLLLEILVGGDKSLCEKALAVLDSICNCQEGRESVHENALAVPVIVKKILRVSDLATIFSISILWKLCSWGNHEKVVVEAVQVGAFQKLLVVLQVGCGETTKEKVSELLKLMNLYRDKLDCFDSSMPFKYVKRSC